MYFALKKYILNQFILYTDALLKAIQDGRIMTIDMGGTEVKLERDKVIYVTTIDKWDARKLPAIAVDIDSIDFEFGSIDKGFAREERAENLPAKKVFVYNSNIRMTMTVYSMFLEERDRLTDILLFLMTRKDIFDFLFSRKIMISSPASIRGFGEEMPPGQDFKIYYGGITLGLLTECIINEISPYPTIGDIISEVTDPIKI